MDRLESELERARDLDVGALADAIETIGFECTRCGACCRAADACGDGSESGSGSVSDDGLNDRPDDGAERDEHTATVFPGEIRRLQATDDYDWRDVARPMPYGLTDGPDGKEGETFEWALQTDECGDCVFYEEDGDQSDANDGDGPRGTCTVHPDRPLVCRTYPFSVALGGTSQPLGEAVDREGMVRAHECEGLGRDIDRAEAESLAATLKRRTVRELEEAIAVLAAYEPTDVEGVVVHDSEGAKRADGEPLGTLGDGSGG